MRFYVCVFLLFAACFCLPALGQDHPGPPDASEWQSFTRRYLTSNGRIIDTANNGISHSEGQGYGMFFAVHFNDQATFDRIWTWTTRSLARPGDSLFSWRYDPRGNPPVSDPNNATDGDIYIAWALLLAHARWNVPEYRDAAARIAADILRLCVTEVDGRTVLLPAAVGFRNAEGVVVNLSYYAFPALRALSRLVVDRRWAQLERDGLELIRLAAFGQWQLPPDWLIVRHAGGELIPAPGWPARFSWDAVRVPLNLAWQGLDEPALTAARQFWEHPGYPQRPPAWIDLRTGHVPPYAGHAGLRSVLALVRLRQGELHGPPLRVADAPDYYGASLVLKARIAAVMPPEPPALEPPEEPRALSARQKFLQRFCEALPRLCPASWRDSTPRPEPVWQRPDPGPVQVRGVPPGYRGRVPPR